MDFKADYEWEWYVGQLFSELIIKSNLKNINTVVELAPGFRFKIALALKNINFNGTLYIIDSSKEVLNYTKEKYLEFIPNANIITINKTFHNSIDIIPNNIDLFLSNHPIDDLMIFNYIESYQNNINIKNKIIDDWNLFLIDSNKIKIQNDIISDFLKLFQTKNIKKIIISQYKSNIYLNEINNKIYNSIMYCFNNIKKVTNTNDDFVNKTLNFYPFGENDERYNYKELLDNMQNAKHWIVGDING